MYTYVKTLTLHFAFSYIICPRAHICMSHSCALVHERVTLPVQSPVHVQCAFPCVCVAVCVSICVAVVCVSVCTAIVVCVKVCVAVCIATCMAYGCIILSLDSLGGSCT